MKMCITATGDTLDVSVDLRVGRAAYFIIVNLEIVAFEPVPNTCEARILSPINA